MPSNLDKYKDDLKFLSERGNDLLLALRYKCLPKEFEAALRRGKIQGTKLEEFKRKLPSFRDQYQTWYSEARAVIRQLLPDRLGDFVRLYEKPQRRKNLDADTYSIEDCLHGISATRGEGIKVVGPEAAIPKFEQQLGILQSAARRFESSLFDIKQLMQADLFDSELETAGELSKNGFTRAAGAIAGVVLERHLRQVCSNHNLKITKKNPTINDLSELLKEAEVIDVSQWRFIQHLSDLRNLCDHDKQKEPTPENVADLIGGVDKITKTLF